MWQGKPSELWSAALGELELQVTRPTYQTWLKDTFGLHLRDGVLVVKVPNSFAAECLEKRMYRLILAAVQRVAGAPLDVQFQVGDGTPAPAAPAETTRVARSADGDGRPYGSPLNERYTFSTFVVGPSNKLAYSAAQAVAQAPGQSYNPLFIYAGVGLGKTHLLHGIGHAVRHAGLAMRYVTSEQFTNEFIAAIRDRTMEEFRARYRSPDVLLIDDIQFISGKEQTQEGFFHTFNDLHNAGRQIVLTCDRPPNALSLLEDRLRSRFAWGLVADIAPPDLETRMAILRNKAAQLRLDIPNPVIEFLARNVQHNIRELEGSLNRVIAFASFTQSAISIDTAKQALADLRLDTSHNITTPDRVLAAVCTHFSIPREALMSKRRDRQTALARQVAMYLLREELDLSLTDIGRLLGNRDHSTVTHAVSKVHEDLHQDATLQTTLVSIKQRLSTST